MKIDRIELFHVTIPLAKPFHPAWIPGYPQTANRFTLARLTTDDGLQGVAAGLAFERERAGLGSLLGPYLIGLDPTDIETGRQRIREASYLGWRNYWLEAAFWDIKGQAEGKPVWQLLGGEAGGRVPVYASTGEVHDPAQRAEEVIRLSEAGFRTVKLRVHSFEPAEDIAQIETVRNAMGDAVALGVDANQGWRLARIQDDAGKGLARYLPTGRHLRRRHQRRLPSHAGLPRAEPHVRAAHVDQRHRADYQPARLRGRRARTPTRISLRTARLGARGA